VTAARFSENSLWDDFLAFHYAGQDFALGIPSIDARITPPGYAPVTVSAPVITPNTVPADKPRMAVSVDVEGKRVAYIYTVTLLKYEDRYLFYEFDYLPADQNRESGGVAYPSWKRENGIIHLEFDYQITPTAVTDGTTSAFAVIEPEIYGRSPSETIYSTKGFYIFSDSGEKISARMYFYNNEDGEMRNIVGYFGSEESGIRTAEITPRKGDQFMFLDTWWEVDENGEFVDVLREGNVLTFGNTPFSQGITPQFVIPGAYSIGVMVEDMDGNQSFSFAPVTVVE